jgi:pyridoxal phosphate enzyme (YggS family)
VSELSRPIEEVRRRIADAAGTAGRDPERICLIAVTKTFPSSEVLAAARVGLSVFGENRVQEAAKKISELRAAGASELEWHLVGRLQRNKVRKALELFDVIQSVDRPELAAELERAAAAVGRRQRILIQVNIDEEPQKGGVPPAAAAALLAQIDVLPHLLPLGLMTIPHACEDPEEVRPSFARLRGLLEDLNRERPEQRQLHELSMGMSADYEIAIQEGATCVRIGTAIFGERRTK